MWIDEQPREDSSGNRWNFCIWSSYLSNEYKLLMAHRLFFWNDDKSNCGVVLFLPESGPAFGRVKALIEKLVADPALREKHRRELRFALRRHYGDHGAFPEEL